jgi:hypothetical protein
MLFPPTQKVINIINHDEEDNDKLLSAINLTWHTLNLNANTKSQKK